MLAKLTPQQTRLMAEVRDEWVNFALFNGDEIDPKATHEGIDFLYELSGLKKPIKIIVDSPLAVQYSIIYAKTLLEALGKGVKGSQVGSQVESQVYSQVGSQVRSPQDFAYETLGWYAGWCAYGEYFKRIGVLKLDKWDEYIKYMRSGQFMGVYLDGLAVVCRRPISVRRDDQLRLHNDQKPAIEWRDGYKLFFLHGQAFEEKLWSKIISQKMTLKDVMGMKNADERTMAWSFLRPDRLLKGIDAKLIHTGIRGTKLYQVDEFSHKISGERKQGDTEYCMTMKDGSTDREFLEWVEPSVGKQKDADFAQATAFQIPLEDYLNIEMEA